MAMRPRQFSGDPLLSLLLVAIRPSRLDEVSRSPSGGLTHLGEEAEIDLFRFVVQQADFDRDPRILQPPDPARSPLDRDPKRNDAALDARGDQRIGARRRLA